MASSTLSASPFRPSLPGLQAPDPAKVKHVSVRTPVRRLPVAASAAPSGAAAAARERRRFLERYGLNPDDFEEDAEEDPRVRLNYFELIRNDCRCGLVGFLVGFFFLFRKRGGTGGDGGSRGEGSKLRKRQLLQRRRRSLGRLTKCFRFGRNCSFVLVVYVMSAVISI